MVIFVLYLFVYSLGLVKCIDVKGARRQDALDSSYKGAAKTAKLLNLVLNIGALEKTEPSNSDEESKKKASDPDLIESMKLLQKNYDTEKQHSKDDKNLRINLQYISNPEVLDVYRKEPARRRDEYDVQQYPKSVRLHIISNPEEINIYREQAARKRAYKLDYEENGIGAYNEEAKRDSRGYIPYLRSYTKALPMESDIEAGANYDDSDSASLEHDDHVIDDHDDDKTKHDNDDHDDDKTKRDKTRRNIVHFRVNEDLVVTAEDSDDNDITLRPEETFDIVKPFIVEIFNKLKEKTAHENAVNNGDDNNFYDPNKISDSNESTSKVMTLDVREITANIPLESWTTATEPQYSIEKNKDKIEVKYKFKKLKGNTFASLFPSDNTELKDSWQKKEKWKNVFRGEQISQEFRNSENRERKNDNKDNYWKDKKLPVSKKSFEAPTFAQEDGGDDQEYGYWKKTDWDTKKGKKESSKITDDFDDKLGKKKSSEISKNNHKNLDDWDKPIKAKDDWDKPIKAKDDWDKPIKTKDDWDKPSKTKDDWDKPSKTKDDWDKPSKTKDDWDKPSKTKDDWDKPSKIKDDWDKPSKTKDDWDKPSKTKDDWDKPSKIKDDWDKPSKTKDDWDKPSKTKDDWDKPSKIKDDWDKPIKTKDNWNKQSKTKEDWDEPSKDKDDWDTPKHKKDDRDETENKWSKTDIKQNKKEDWDKNEDNWDDKKTRFKKKDNWSKKDTKLPDNKKRDSAWDKVGLDYYKKSGESQTFERKKQIKIPSSGNEETFRNVKEKTVEKDTYRDDFRDDYKPKKYVEIDSFVPKLTNNYNKAKKAASYDSYERKPGNPGFGGRTSIPMRGKKPLYD